MAWWTLNRTSHEILMPIFEYVLERLHHFWLSSRFNRVKCLFLCLFYPVYPDIKSFCVRVFFLFTLNPLSIYLDCPANNGVFHSLHRTHTTEHQFAMAVVGWLISFFPPLFHISGGFIQIQFQTTNRFQFNRRNENAKARRNWQIERNTQNKVDFYFDVKLHEKKNLNWSAKSEWYTYLRGH